ncbi:APC family permease [Micromonospora sp. CA-263727]|uniref:APC family permease n=1 Tax=Micromonospora sp. CA-263727 TaxID=3239967 RepID=UPI003D8BB9C1
MTGQVQVALARRTLSPVGLWVFGAAASAPMVVLAGGIPAIYATTGVVAVPVTYLLVAAGVAVLAVAYTAMARQVGHPAAYYGILAHGLGRGWGVAAGMVALVAYGAIQTSLYGLIGATLTAQFGGVWWVWAGIAVAVVGVTGVRAIMLSTRLLAVVLAGSLLLVAVFVLAAVTGPAGGAVSWKGFDVSGLAVTGIGGAVAFCVASLMGIDAPASFAEEAVDRHSIGRATVAGALLLSGVYAVAAWAMGVAVGPDLVARTAADPAAGLPYSILQGAGGWWVPVAGVMLVFAIVTSMLAFHSVFARYVFAMAREGVLPAWLAGAGGGTRVTAPRGGSVTQTCVAAVTVGGFAAAGADPVTAMFTWLSSLGAMGLLGLLLAASMAALTAPAAVRGTQAGMWEWRIAPALGILAGSALLVVMVGNAGSLLGAAPGSVYPYLLPAILAGTAVLGGMWAAHLRQSRPDIYAGIGRGTPSTHAVPDAITISI